MSVLEEYVKANSFEFTKPELADILETSKQNISNWVRKSKVLIDSTYHGGPIGYDLEAEELLKQRRLSSIVTESERMAPRPAITAKKYGGKKSYDRQTSKDVDSLIAEARSTGKATTAVSSPKSGMSPDALNKLKDQFLSGALDHVTVAHYIQTVNTDVSHKTKAIQQLSAAIEIIQSLGTKETVTTSAPASVGDVILPEVGSPVDIPREFFAQLSDPYKIDDWLSRNSCYVFNKQLHRMLPKHFIIADEVLDGREQQLTPTQRNKIRQNADAGHGAETLGQQITNYIRDNEED